MSAILAAMTRHIMGALGAVWGSSDADVGAALRALIEKLAEGDTNALGGTIVTLAAICWSIYDKKAKAKKKEIKS
ncbi:MAG TPA: hypothetical protein PKE26_11030 [Kiritimatiellia bacterium]|nr:hypothetical protein [Kiritimatiellia bacterium]HMO99632.1 hypothetical protein [Kiritimatiellia bacterium]HMP97121.1 hypothetical protein [Kiritimatiellia bacterium]